MSLHQGRKSGSFIIVRILLGAVFLFSGGSKLADLTAFFDVVSSYAFIPSSLVVYTSVSIVLTEIFLGGLLILGKLVNVAAIGASFLLTMFIIVVWFSNNIVSDCGCFGPIRVQATRFHVAFFDIVLLIGSFVVYLHHNTIRDKSG